MSTMLPLCPKYLVSEAEVRNNRH